MSLRTAVLGLSIRGYLNWMPERIFLRMLFFIRFGRFLHLKNPRGFNEKLNWLKLHDRKDFYSTLVDKYAVKKYVAENVGEKYVVPLIGVYNSFEEIDFNVLPDQFVLKCTHSSHASVICTDKKQLEIEKTRKSFSVWMKRNLYWFAREWPYKNVEPKIICEKFLSNNGKVPEDYKVFCFNGEPKLIRVDLGRFVNITHDFYTVDWQRTKYSCGKHADKDAPKPVCLDEMIRLSAVLSKDIPHVRIDWYIVEGQLYFGEITFYDGGGLSDFGDLAQELTIGSWIKLPII